MKPNIEDIGTLGFWWVLVISGKATVRHGSWLMVVYVPGELLLPRISLALFRLS